MCVWYTSQLPLNCFFQILHARSALHAVCTPSRVANRDSKNRCLIFSVQMNNSQTLLLSSESRKGTRLSPLLRQSTTDNFINTRASIHLKLYRRPWVLPPGKNSCRSKPPATFSSTQCIPTSILRYHHHVTLQVVSLLYVCKLPKPVPLSPAVTLLQCRHGLWPIFSWLFRSPILEDICVRVLPQTYRRRNTRLFSNPS